MEQEDASSRRLEKLWGYHKEADGILHNRAAAFIVAQSIIVASFATIFSSSAPVINKNLSALFLCFVGFLVSVLWIRANAGLCNGIDLLKKEMCCIDSDYEKYLSACREKMLLDRFIPNNLMSQKYLMPYWLPAFFILMWIVFSLLIFAQVYKFSVYNYTKASIIYIFNLLSFCR